MRKEEIDLIEILKDKYDKFVVVDVGANVGNYFDYVFNNLNIEKAYLFEPIGSCFDKLLNKFNDKNIIIKNLALGSYKGEVEFNEAIGKESHSSIVNRNWLYSKLEYNIERKIVKLDRLDNIISGRINLLKIDTEGYELETLKGCSELLSNEKIDYIQFEYGGTFKDNSIKLNDVIYFLNLFGYGVYELYDNRFIRIENYIDDYKCINFFSFKNK